MSPLSNVASLLTQNGHGLSVVRWNYFKRKEYWSNMSIVKVQYHLNWSMWWQKVFHGASWRCAKVKKKKTYYQCQGDSTGIKKIGFVVYYNETYIETIKLEEEKWRNETLLLFAKFYFEFLTLPVNKKVLSKSYINTLYVI